MADMKRAHTPLQHAPEPVKLGSSGTAPQQHAPSDSTEPENQHLRGGRPKSPTPTPMLRGTPMVRTHPPSSSSMVRPGGSGTVPKPRSSGR